MNYPVGPTEAYYGAKLLEMLRGAWPKVQKRFQFYLSQYFYRDTLVKAFLFERDFSDLPKTEFIDYRCYLDYYASDIKPVTLRMGSTDKTLKLPYREEINFIESPSAQINVVGSITDYNMPQALRELTENNLRAYLRVQPQSWDNPILRVSSFVRQDSTHYECSLERSTYYYQARTNLTIDCPLEGEAAKTLRTLDLGPSNSLRSLEDSILVNSIGVSAVVFFRKSGDIYFFMKYRRGTEGVFGHMFGTTSGVVTLPKGQPVRSLVDYVYTEMRREFYRETGFDEDRDRLPIRNMVLLSFARELMRGGKPQFFFVIEIDEIDERQFKTKFRTSAEGLQEFHDDLYHNNKYSAVLSPEFATNLIYALQFFQSEKRLSADPVLLG